MADGDSEEKKKTRIPKLRFRDAMNRVRLERRQSAESEEGLPSFQRRSSIPRLKKLPPMEKPKQDEAVAIVDDFDKIYDEIIQNPADDVDNSILNIKVDDSNAVNQFEELLHAYDDIAAQPVEKPKQSRIPMFKRKSEHEIEVPKSIVNETKHTASNSPKIRDEVKNYSRLLSEESKNRRKLPSRTLKRNSYEENSLKGKRRDSKSKINMISDDDFKASMKEKSTNSDTVQSQIKAEGNIKLTENNDKTQYATVQIGVRTPISNEIVEISPVQNFPVENLHKTSSEIKVEKSNIVLNEAKDTVIEKPKIRNIVDKYNRVNSDDNSSEKPLVIISNVKAKFGEHSENGLKKVREAVLRADHPKIGIEDSVSNVKKYAIEEIDEKSPIYYETAEFVPTADLTVEHLQANPTEIDHEKSRTFVNDDTETVSEKPKIKDIVNKYSRVTSDVSDYRKKMPSRIARRNSFDDDSSPKTRVKISNIRAKYEENSESNLNKAQEVIFHKEHPENGVQDTVTNVNKFTIKEIDEKTPVYNEIVEFVPTEDATVEHLQDNPIEIDHEKSMTFVNDANETVIERPNIRDIVNKYSRVTSDVSDYRKRMPSKIARQRSLDDSSSAKPHIEISNIRAKFEEDSGNDLNKAQEVIFHKEHPENVVQDIVTNVNKFTIEEIDEKTPVYNEIVEFVPTADLTVEHLQAHPIDIGHEKSMTFVNDANKTVDERPKIRDIVNKYSRVTSDDSDFRKKMPSRMAKQRSLEDNSSAKPLVEISNIRAKFEEHSGNDLNKAQDINLRKEHPKNDIEDTISYLKKYAIKEIDEKPPMHYESMEFVPVENFTVEHLHDSAIEIEEDKSAIFLSTANDAVTERPNIRDIVNKFNLKSSDISNYRRNFPDENNISTTYSRNIVGTVLINKGNPIIKNKTSFEENTFNAVDVAETSPNVSNYIIEEVEEKVPMYDETIVLLSEEVGEEFQGDVKIEPITIDDTGEFNLLKGDLIRTLRNYSEESLDIRPTPPDTDTKFIDDNIFFKNSEYDKNKDSKNINIKNVNNIVENIYLLKNQSSDEDIPLIKGKVDRMIKRLHSREPKDKLSEDFKNEIPEPKSVLSKIALFERKETADCKIPSRDPTIPKCRFRNYSDNKTDKHKDTPPKIVSTILKAIPVEMYRAHDNIIYNKTNHEENNNNIRNYEVLPVKVIDMQDSICIAEEFVADDYIHNADKGLLTSENNVLNTYTNLNPVDFEEELTPVEVEIEHIQPTNHFNQGNDMNCDDNTNEIRIAHNYKDVAFKPYAHVRENSRYNDVTLVETPNHTSQFNDIKVFESENIESDLKRHNSVNTEVDWDIRKSVGEVELGNVIKGKVQAMIVRINSSETLNVDNEKKEFINVKELPRKKSVSEKIALFERKLPTTEKIAKPTSLSESKQYLDLDNEKMTLLNKKKEELVAATLKYGRLSKVDTIPLNNGLEMPCIVLGTAYMDPKLTTHVVAAAIDMGYRGIDSAHIYGNEREVGEAIRLKIEDGTVRREELFVVSKLWSTYHRTDLVEKACRQSLNNMGLDYFDQYLVHYPVSFKEGNDILPKIANVLQYSEHDYLSAWFGMEGLVKRGLARSIGVSNFNSQQLQRILDRARIKPVINQVESHPFLAQRKLDNFCTERGVKLSCYGVLGSTGTPVQSKSQDNPVLEDPLVQVMAAGLEITPAQLAIRFQLEQGRIAVVKASSGSRLFENLLAATVTLNDVQVDALSSLNRNRRTYMYKGMGDTHRNYPFRIPF